MGLKDRLKRLRQNVEERQYYAGRKREIRDDKRHQKDLETLDKLKKREKHEKTRHKIRKKKDSISKTKQSARGGGFGEFAFNDLM